MTVLAFDSEITVEIVKNLANCLNIVFFIAIIQLKIDLLTTTKQAEVKQSAYSYAYWYIPAVGYGMDPCGAMVELKIVSCD